MRGIGTLAQQPIDGSFHVVVVANSHDPLCLAALLNATLLAMLGLSSDRRLPTVLLIDDDMVSREVMATVLTMSGYTVHTAPNGQDALALLDGGACEPEVILMDTQMPGVSGSELIQGLRRRSSAVLYAISGSHAPNDVMEGTDGFLMKPIGPEALQRVLMNHTIETEPLPLAEVPVINEETLAQLRAVMPDKAVCEIFAAVLADIDHREAALYAAIASGNGAEVRRIGHALKGGCGMAGALQAARIGELLETRGDDLEYSRSVVGHLQGAAQDLQSMLNAVFSGDGAFSPQGMDPQKNLPRPQ